MKRELAIVVPVFNTSRYLLNFLDSIKNQTFQDFDVYLVDDGSTDNTFSILKKHCNNNKFRIFTKANGGVSSARNYALDQIATSQQVYKYIYFCDSDDYLLPDTLNKVLSSLRRNEADYALFSVIYKYKTKEECVHEKSSQEFIIDNSDIAKQYFRYGLKWYKRSFTEGFLNNKIFLFEYVKGMRFDESLKRSEDFDMFYRILPKLRKGVVVPSAFYCYRKRKTSLTNSISENGDLSVCIKNYSSLDKYSLSVRRAMQHKLIRAIYTNYCSAIDTKDLNALNYLEDVIDNFRVEVFPFISDVKPILLMSLPRIVLRNYVILRNRVNEKNRDLSDYFD